MRLSPRFEEARVSGVLVNNFKILSGTATHLLAPRIFGFFVTDLPRGYNGIDGERWRETMPKKRRKRRGTTYPRMDDQRCVELFGIGFRELGKRCGKHPADAWDTLAAPRFPRASVALIYRQDMDMDYTSRGEAEVERLDEERRAEEETARELSEFHREERARFEAYLATYAEEDEQDDNEQEHEESEATQEPTPGYLPGYGPMDINRKPPPMTNKRGGKREGSGRKPREKAPARHVRAVRLTEAEDVRYSKWMRSGESWGAFLRRVLEAHARVQERVQRTREQQTQGPSEAEFNGDGED